MHTRLAIVLGFGTFALLMILTGETAGQGAPGKAPTPAKKNKKGSRPGEIITPAAKGERKTDTLRVGDPAPDFTLPILKGEGSVHLAEFLGNKPVVLVFASYT